MRALSLAYWALICLTCPIFYAGAAIVWALTAAWDRRRVLVHMYSCVWALFYVYVNPLWKLRTTGRDRLPWRSGAVLVSNHASLIDILVMYHLLRPFKWVSKLENFKLPFVGWSMTLNGYVPLVRGDRESVRKMLAQCGELLRGGSPVLFFPEGTRTRHGNLLPFRDGAFELAAEHGVPLIPIALHGTGRALPKHGLILRSQVDAHVEVLEPLDPAAFTSVAALRDAARERIATALHDGG